MNFEKTLEKLHRVLPFEAEKPLLEAIVMKSSFIEFHGTGETLFKTGDLPLGFYWILAGHVKIDVPNNAAISLKKGEMAGLDSFLTQDRHRFNILTASSRVQVLFINGTCFAHLRENADFRKLINRQILNQLRSYRGLLDNPKNLLLNT